MKQFAQLIYEFTNTYPVFVTAKRQIKGKKHMIKKDDSIKVNITDIPTSTFDINLTDKNGSSMWHYESKSDALKDWIIK